MTNLLEMATGHPVTITTRVQDSIGADPKIATALDIEPDDEVNCRVVELQDSITGEVLIYAVSCTPLRRLAPEFRKKTVPGEPDRPGQRRGRRTNAPEQGPARVHSGISPLLHHRSVGVTLIICRRTVYVCS